MENIDIAQILKNAINNSENSYKTEHILSGIDTIQAFILANDNKVLKIYTQENDILTLNLANENKEKGEWKQISSNDSENFATFISTVDSEIKILVDETKVETLI